MVKKRNKRSTLASEDRMMNVSDMALILKPSLRSPKQIKKSKVSKVFEWGKKEFAKADELLLKRKSQIILETAKRLDELGVAKSTISTEIAREYKGYVDATYVPLVLKDYPQYKQEYRVSNAKKAKSSSNIRAKQEQQLLQEEQQQEEDDGERAEIYEIKLSDARIQDVDRYDIPALRRLLTEALQKIQELEQRLKEDE